jgi:hypothetical protein
VDNPNEAFIRVDFSSAEMAKAFRERLLLRIFWPRSTALNTTERPDAFGTGLESD